MSRFNCRKWALASVEAAEAGGSVGPGHHRMLAGDVVWCLRCGCYGGVRARGLAGVCLGKPTDRSGGGRAGQLNCLLAGKHPRTRKPMPQSIDENGSIFKLVGSSMRAESRDQPNAVQPVVPAVGDRGSSTSDAGGKSSAQKHRDRLERVREKERETKRAARLALPPTLRLRGKQRPGKQWEYVDHGGLRGT
jgi:hypothetical protein